MSNKKAKRSSNVFKELHVTNVTSLQVDNNKALKVGGAVSVIHKVP